ncbi:MAG: efflux RND transporter permease subunit [Lachnospiraceae bacterium]|nr:efflux RND transporter permease subunit [Lachnospiraceae bacterium]
MLGKFSVKKPYTVLVAVVLVIVLGVVSFTKMTTDLLPNISLPYVVVMTSYPGASPETVEMVVTKPVEASMATVSNIEGISSVSSENYSVVILEFAQSADMDAVSLEIRENLDQIESYWDDTIGSPIIMKLNPDMLPVMIAAVGGEGMTPAEISEMTQNTIIPELESIEGVASASATGLLEESVHVVIRQEKIDVINEQVFASIDVEIDEAKAELEESKQEVYDGQAEVAEARQDLEQTKLDLETSRQELADSRLELEDSKQEIADGKTELEEKKTELETGKTELNSQKEATTAQLAAAETQIITAKADLEASKIHLTLEVTTIETALEGLATAEAGLQTIKDQAAAYGVTDKADIATVITNLETLRDTTGPAMSAGLQAKDQTMTLKDGAVEWKDGVIQTLTMLGVTSITEDSLISEAVTALDTALLGIDAQITGLNTLETAWTQAETSIATVEESINTKTMGLGADAYLAQLQTSITEITNNITNLDSALTQLYQGNLTAAIEFANAQTAISLGEVQITSAEAQLETAEAQLESAEAQIEAGEEQLKAGEEQIVSGEEQLADTETQLADALQQILDGEVELEESRLDAYDQADMHGVLTVETVEALLAAQNFSMPAGYVTEEGISYLIRVGDKPEDIESLKKMPLINLEMDGVDVITLGDVADVFMTDNSADIYANVNGESGIMVTIQKQTGYSTGEVSDRILEKFDQLMAEDENLMLITLMDQGIYIDLVMDSIINNILFGGALAIFILIIFLKDIRPTAVIACSIPISLVTAIVCMYFSGVTLNVISLSGLALGIGMLVDNSIVVIENIYRLRREGYSAREAAIEGAGEVAGAILASTLTTVCVFAPIVFTEGITRQLFVDMGLTIAYSLLASLIVALTVVPAMASKALTKTKDNQDGKFFTWMTNIYEKLLKVSLRFKPVVLLLVVALLVVTAYASYSKGTAFMPEMDSTQITVSLTMPKDTPLTDTAKVSDEIVDILKQIPEVQDVGAMAGSTGMASLMGGGDAVTNATDIYVTLSEDKERSNEEIAKEAESLLAPVCEREAAEVAIQTATMDMSALGGSGISIQIRGRELDTLQELAVDIAAIVESVEGTQNVSNGLEESTGELRIIIDRDKAIAHGLTVAEVFQQISAKLASSTSATTFTTDAKEYDVYVKHAGDMALTRELVKNLEIERTKQDGTKEVVLLKELAKFENTISPKAVNRVEQNRYIQVSAEIADGYNVGLVSQVLEEELDKYQMPTGYTLVMSGENETINEAMEQLYLMLILALVFMYLIMVAQFQSLLSPFIIMFTIPLAFTGGFMGLIITDSELSVIALIGFVMLSGIIVNNGIVLVDYMNQLRSEGMEKREAILKAGRTRLRPVLMTALTTILALCTTVFSEDMGADMTRPMSIVTIGGLVYGTLLTLVVIPCVYDIFSKEKKEKSEKKRFWRGKKEKQLPEGNVSTNE